MWIWITNNIYIMPFCVHHNMHIYVCESTRESSVWFKVWFLISGLISHPTDHYLYYAAGEHIKRVVLPYRARKNNCICCIKDYIILAGFRPSAIHIHGWSGEHLRTLSQQELNIPKDVFIISVNCDMALDTLFLALGLETHRTEKRVSAGTNFLQAYRVSTIWYSFNYSLISQTN